LAASQKIRTGLVELRTSIGTVYVRPSFWERVYLLWVFRNFHCLPREVLGLHQRRLIDKLCQAAVRQQSIAQTDIIGIVENVQLAPKRKADVAVTTSNLIEMVSSTAQIGIPRAVAAGGTPMRWDPPADGGDIARLIAPNDKVEEISPPKKLFVPQDESGKADPAPATEPRAGGPARRLAWILASVLVAAGVGILFRFQTQARPLPPAIVSQPPLPVSPPVPVSAPATEVALPGAVLPSMASDPVRPQAIPENAPSHPSIALPQSEVKRNNQAIASLVIATPEIANEDLTPEPRLQLAQPPESGFRYPETPSSALTGKVSLRAVIGTDGTVRKIDVLSGNRALAVAAVRAVRHWRYPAPEMNGHAVEAETNIAINFLGDDAVSISFPATR